MTFRLGARRSRRPLRRVSIKAGVPPDDAVVASTTPDKGEGVSARRRCLSIVLVEQNAKLVFDVADDIVILNSGRVVVDGSAMAVKANGGDLRQHLGIYRRWRPIAAWCPRRFDSSGLLGQSVGDESGRPPCP